MYAEGETELRDLIVQNLESCGFLNKIKAELRAGVFLAFEEEGSLRKKIPLFNKKFDNFIDTPDGKLVVSVVREFLEYFNLNFTLSVFDPEIASSSPCYNRVELLSKFNLKSSDIDGPILSALMKPEQIAKRTDVISNTENRLGLTNVTSLDIDFDEFTGKEKSGSSNSSVLENLNLTNRVNYPTAQHLDKDKLSIENMNSKKNSISDPSPKADSTMMIELKNESPNFESHDKETTLDVIISSDKSNTSGILKSQVNSSILDNDPFFDEPLPSEKPSYFNVPHDSGSFNVHGLKDTLEKNTLSSLKDLPSLATKSQEWTFSRELPKTFLSFDPTKPDLEKSVDDAPKLETIDSYKKDPDPESNEELSEQQLNSEESIEEDIEEDFSAGVDDLLNSSLSLCDDATSDQTVSQVSVVDGVDHIEPCNSVK